jgi:RimJ/RimL family protein N-acetyltransferase
MQDILSTTNFQLPTVLNHLQGEHVYLKFLKQADFAELKLLAKDERIWEFTRGIIVNEQYEEQIEKYLSLALDPNALGGQQAFVIRQKSDDAIIGMTRIYGFEPRHRRFTIGYTWYIPVVWGRVHNKE